MFTLVTMNQAASAIISVVTSSVCRTVDQLNTDIITAKLPHSVLTTMLVLHQLFLNKKENHHVAA